MDVTSSENHTKHSKSYGSYGVSFMTLNQPASIISILFWK